MLISHIISGKKSITPETAIQLAAAFGTNPEYWMGLETQYQLSLAQTESDPIRRRAKMLELGPLKEMQRRGWIETTSKPGVLEAEILRFFEIGSLDQRPGLEVATRRSQPDQVIEAAQVAWCYRVRHLARSLVVPPFDESKLGQCKQALKKLAAYPSEARKVPRVLADHGIRFVIVEPLKGSKIDGAAMWLDERSPVIGLSARFDRIDGFWFTLGHEFTHVERKDALSIDLALSGEERGSIGERPPMELAADDGASAMLIDPDAIESFIRRVGPQYSKQRIVQFAHRIKVHPGIIVGQLQHRGEIGFHTFREMLVKVRETVVATSLVDGWGYALGTGGSS
jgi:HTH-type transcriptional regulator/antitoxin HigA